MKNLYLKLSLLLCTLLFAQSCANYKLQYASEAENWKTQNPASELKIDHTVFLIGNAGYYSSLPENPTLQVFKKHLEAAGENSSVIFLGDNAPPGGLPRKAEPEKRTDAEGKLEAQLKTLENFKGRPYFIAGDQDWKGDGVKGVRRQERYIEKHLNKGIEDDEDWEDYFFPSDGCGDPTIVEVNDRLVFLFVDSNWYIKDWDKEHPSLNEDCQALSRPVFRFLFEELARKYKNKNVIIASHHPMFSYGFYGGKFSAKEHLFPLTQVNEELYIPLPGIGTLGNVLRTNFGFRQDLAHPMYKRMKNDILFGATKNGKFIFAAAHEHNMQYIERSRQNFIVSGGGGQKKPVALGKGSKFAHGGTGFSKIDFYEDGSAWLSFFAVGADGKTEKIYHQKIKDKLPISEENIPENFPEFESGNKVVKRTPTLMKVEEKGKLHAAVMGKHYREMYMNQYEFPVLDLKDFEGGVVPIKRGGGNQTNSLRLETKDGRQFAMRALTKDASRLVPYPINKMSVAKSVAEENFMSTHPFAPLVIPKMAKAANVYYTNPQYFYVPKQPVLGVHNDLFGGDVYLIEERPSKGHEKVKSFGESEKFYGTPDVVQKITNNHKHKVDQNWVLRSRLFDMVIGDWDRHDDQWRWHMHKEGDKNIYRPIPRDRDQALSKYDGLVSTAARIFMPFLRQLKTYDYEIKNETRWENWSSRFFNMTFLNEIPWEEWEKEAQFIKENLTDEVIAEAFKNMPAFAFEDSGEELMRKLKKRRDDIVKYARQFYEFYSDEIVVYGTDKKERFEVTRMPGGKTLVEVFHKDDKVYSRLFDKKITKEIHLYGMGDDDSFNLKGKATGNSLIRVIGGEGDDKVTTTDGGPSNKNKVYDSVGGIEIEAGAAVVNKTSNYKLLNYFDRRDVQYEHNFDTKLPILGFNIDDGLILGAMYRLINYKFKKYPYAQEHKVSALFGFSTKAYEITYNGAYMEAVGRWDLTTDFKLHGDRNTFNYFGFGTDSERIDEDKRFNEVRMSQGLIDIGLQKRFANNNAAFKFFPLVEWVEVQATEGRFITQANNGLPEDIFESKFFAGGGFQFNYNNLDNFIAPKQGVRINTMYRWRKRVDEKTDAFSHVRGSLTLYLPLDKEQNFVFASRVGGGANFGGDYDFFHGQAIGGDFLRGYRNERFLGDVAFFHNNDLRLKVLSYSNNVLPLSIGLHGGFDYGKVWLYDNPEDQEGRWRTSIGGGFWLSPVDIGIISFGFYYSDDDTRVVVKAGHLF